MTKLLYFLEVEQYLMSLNKSGVASIEMKLVEVAEMGEGLVLQRGTYKMLNNEGVELFGGP